MGTSGQRPLLQAVLPWMGRLLQAVLPVMGSPSTQASATCCMSCTWLIAICARQGQACHSRLGALRRIWHSSRSLLPCQLTGHLRQAG